MVNLPGETRRPESRAGIGVCGRAVVIPDSVLAIHRTSIVSLATRSNVPALYWNKAFVTDGGLLSYGPDYRDVFHRAATYVDRILKGEKPADLPVELTPKSWF